MNERLKKLINNKFFVIFSLFILFGAISVFAGNIFVNENGIQSDNYYSSDGEEGLTQNVYCKGIDGQNYTLIFKNGLMINFTQGIMEEENSSFPSSGLVSYYKFNETSGTTANDEVGNIDGALYNTPIWEAGKIGNGLNFTRVSSEYVSFSSGLFGFNQQTVSFWFKPTQTLSSATTDNQYIYGTPYGGGNGYLMQVTGTDATTRIQVYAGQTQIIGISKNDANLSNWYKSGQWALVVITMNSTGDNKLYVFSDSGDYNYNSTTSWTPYNSPSFKIGATGDLDAGYYYDGMVDEVGIWNRTLTFDEISNLYNDGDGLTYS